MPDQFGEISGSERCHFLPSAFFCFCLNHNFRSAYPLATPYLLLAKSSYSCYRDDCFKYGKLYNWNTAMTACPKGWHLPSNAEWDRLSRYADGTSKATSGWEPYRNGTDAYGFVALSGGGYGGSGNSEHNKKVGFKLW
jgi:uncharacterized protein (TIGR02145 family)